MHFEVAFFAYLIDRVFGEFSFIRRYKHPVVLMGEFIAFFEKRWYKDSVIRGGLLVFLLLLCVGSFVSVLEYYIDNTFILALIASTGLASKSLQESVGKVITDPGAIRFLVSRDTQHLDQNGINKAAIETYGENLSDGVIAPLLYLLLFGLTGLFLYKAVNTLDSMIGYKTPRYDRFGKIAARLDDIANLIPSRITALLILLLCGKSKTAGKTARQGSRHKSPNAGYPIAAIAHCTGVQLGGSASYFGTMEYKPSFGNGKKAAGADDLRQALSLQRRIDFCILLLLGAASLCTMYG